jgi:hypothetical protein
VGLAEGFLGMKFLSATEEKRYSFAFYPITTGRICSPNITTNSKGGDQSKARRKTVKPPYENVIINGEFH